MIAFITLVISLPSRQETVALVKIIENPNVLILETRENTNTLPGLSHILKKREEADTASTNITAPDTSALTEDDPNALVTEDGTLSDADYVQFKVDQTLVDSASTDKGRKVLKKAKEDSLKYAEDELSAEDKLNTYNDTDSDDESSTDGDDSSIAD